MPDTKVWLESSQRHEAAAAQQPRRQAHNAQPAASPFKAGNMKIERTMVFSPSYPSCMRASPRRAIGTGRRSRRARARFCKTPRGRLRRGKPMAAPRGVQQISQAGENAAESSNATMKAASIFCNHQRVRR